MLVCRVVTQSLTNSASRFMLPTRDFSTIMQISLRRQNRGKIVRCEPGFSYQSRILSVAPSNCACKRTVWFRKFLTKSVSLMLLFFLGGKKRRKTRSRPCLCGGHRNVKPVVLSSSCSGCLASVLERPLENGQLRNHIRVWL